MAAVFPGAPLQRPAHRQSRLPEVDVGPLQPQHLALSKPQSQAELPSHPVTTAGRYRQHGTTSSNDSGCVSSPP